MGIKSFAVLSDGRKIDNPKFFSIARKRLRKAQRKLCRRLKGSNNRTRQKLVVAKIHEKVSAVRADFLHKLTHTLTHESQVKSIVCEDLNVTGMVKNHCLARSISDCSWGEFIRQLKYKCEWYGINFIQIGRFEPSSKLCSSCGSINHSLTLKDREWTCPSCGVVHDRDVNASQNIKVMGLHPRLKTVPMDNRESTLTESNRSKGAR